MTCDACGVADETVRPCVVRGQFRFTFCRRCRARHAAMPIEVDSDDIG